MESAIQQRRERSCLLSLGTETVEISWWDNILNALRKQKNPVSYTVASATGTAAKISKNIKIR